MLIPLFLLFSNFLVYAEIHQVLYLTDGGEHANPRFNSFDGSSIFVTAKGGPYESDCEHVYRIDLNQPLTPIGLASLGFGAEGGAVSGTPNDYTSDLYELYTNGLNIATQTDQKAQYTTNSFCPKRICDSPPAQLRDACNRPHVERPDDTSYTYFTAITIFFSNYDKNDKTPNPPVFSGPNRILRSYANGKKGTNLLFYNNKHNLLTKFYKDTNFMVDGFDTDGYKIVFHGAEVGNDGDAYAAGVQVLDKFEIYETNWDDVENGNFKLGTPVVQKPTGGYLTNPRYLQDGSGSFFYTFTDSNGKSQIKLHTPGQAVDQLILEQAKDIDVIIFNQTTYITYLRDISDNSWQVNLATYNSNNLYPTNFTSTRFVDTHCPYFEYAQVLYQRDIDKSPEPPFHLRFSNDWKWLMFIDGDYSQVFQMDLHTVVRNSARRLSSGLRFHESPVFTGFDGRDDVWFVSTISESKRCANRVGADIWICEQDPCLRVKEEAFQNACKAIDIKQKKFLSNNNEIYHANQFGTVKRRLTNNDYYEGELVINLDRTSVVFSSNRNDDYDLYIAPVDNIGNPKQLTNKLGFEGGVSFRPNSNAIVYYASRPSGDDEINRYNTLRKYSLIDRAASDIYYLDLNTMNETRLTHLGFVQAPVFNPTGSKIYFLQNPQGKFESILFSIDVETKEVKQLYSMSEYLHDLTIASNGAIAYVRDRDVILARLNEDPIIPTTTIIPSTTSTGSVQSETSSFWVFLTFFVYSIWSLNV
ncbi:Protein TolB [Aphelenchoides besseyi]|nr:Protein TolB [Aphelenchoides besseyi]